MNKLLIICGPTATGKTALGRELASRFDGELISADSRQVYIGMDIGTGKDIPKGTKFVKKNAALPVKNQSVVYGYYDLEGIPLWLVSLVKPNQEFSLSHFHDLVEETLKDIRNRNKLPIVIGGTGLYLKSLTHTLSTMHIPPNQQLRQQLAFASANDLARELQRVNESKWLDMNLSDRQNPRRLLRAIEIAYHKKEHPEVKEEQTEKTQDTFTIGLTATLQELYRRIDRRVEERMRNGMIEEIQALLTGGYSWELPSMTAIGYKEWRDFFAKKTSLEEIRHQWQYHEHAYARRQMTWFKKMPNIHWYQVSSSSYRQEVFEDIESWYTLN